MTIAFNELSIDFNTPGSHMEFDGSGAFQGTPAMPKRLLLIGNRLSTGTVAAEVLTQILGKDDGVDFFGRGSQLANMCSKAKRANKNVEVYAIALADAGGAVATIKTVTFAGTATEDGTIHMLFNGVRIPIPVASGDDGAAQATAAAAAFALYPDLIATAAVNGGTPAQLDITCRHAAEFGNYMDIRFNYDRTSQKYPAGVTAPVVATGTPGTTNPDVADAIAMIGSKWMTSIALGYSDATNVATAEAHALDQWGAFVQKDVHIFAARKDSAANLITYGGSRNSPFSTIMDNGNCPTPPWEWAATLAAVEESEGDPARPRQYMRLPNVLGPESEDQLDRPTRDLLLGAGIATFLIDDSGQISIERLVATYKTNPQSVDDPTYMDIETLRTLAYLRFSTNARILSKYARYKLADDGTTYPPGAKVVTPSVIKGELIALFIDDWLEKALVEGLEQFKTDLVVERDKTSVNRMNALIPPDVINQFRQFASIMPFKL